MCLLCLILGVDRFLFFALEQTSGSKATVQVLVLSLLVWRRYFDLGEHGGIAILANAASKQNTTGRLPGKNTEKVTMKTFTELTGTSQSGELTLGGKGGDRPWCLTVTRFTRE